MWGGSSSRGTGEPCLGDTGELSLRAYEGSAADPASAARSGADVSSSDILVLEFDLVTVFI